MEYKVVSPDIDEIVVMGYAGGITQQVYYKDNRVLKKVESFWNVKNSILYSVKTDVNDVLIIPPEISDQSIMRVNKNAFDGVTAELVVFPMTRRMTFETGAVDNIKEVRIYSTMKRSQITDNMKCYGRILEDVHDRA